MNLFLLFLELDLWVHFVSFDQINVLTSLVFMADASNNKVVTLVFVILVTLVNFVTKKSTNALEFFVKMVQPVSIKLDTITVIAQADSMVRQI
jgi:hypothetical protein